MRKDLRASVTLLIVCIFPALLFSTCVSIDVSQYYANKTICESAVDLGINSALAAYDRNLYKDYGLMGTNYLNIYDNFTESYYSNLSKDKDTKIRVRASDYLYEDEALFQEMCKAGAIKNFRQTGNYVDEKLAAEYYNCVDWYSYGGYPSLIANRPYYVVGKLIGDLSTLIEKHNLETDKNARGIYASEIATKMVQIEEYDPDFRSKLNDGSYEYDGWFYINEYYPEIELSTWNALWNNLSAYSFQVLPNVFNNQINGVAYDSNSAKVDSLLSNYPSFESNEATFYYSNSQNYNDLDTYDEQALGLFDNIDTWDENWMGKSVEELDSQFSFLEEVERVMRYGNISMGNCNTALCDYIVDYFSYYGGSTQTEASVMPNREVEYILGGQSDSGTNCQIVFNRILAMRFWENFKVIEYQIGYQQQSFNSPSYNDYRYCDFYKYLEENTRWALLESFIETYLVMVRNEPIATVKTPENMITTRNNLGSGIDIDKVKAVIDGASLDYEECLKLLLMDQHSYFTVNRARCLINENQHLRYGDLGANLDDMCTTIIVGVNTKASAKFTSALQLPGTDVDTSSVLHFENISIEEKASYIDQE